MGKYESYDHPTGLTRVGDIVAAFVPLPVGRAVMEAEVVRINRKSIRVQYNYKGRDFVTTLKEHHWCFLVAGEDK